MTKTIICICFLIFANTLGAQTSKTTKTTKVKKVVATVVPPTSVKLSVKDFEFDAHRDSINIIMTDNLRYGNWVEKTMAAFGEDPFIKFGKYYAGKKIGKWYTYTNDLISMMETYKNGVRDGEIRYFEDGLIILRGYYKAVKLPAKDTIEVAVPGRTYDSTVVLENDTKSVKEGIWTYYKTNGRIAYKEYYYMDELIQTQNMEVEDIVDPDYIAEEAPVELKKDAAMPKTVDPFAKQNKGRKPTRYTDFREDGKGVKPNKRKQ